MMQWLAQVDRVDHDAWWLIIAPVALVIVYVVMRPLTRKKDPLAKPPGLAGLAQQRAVERQMSNLLVDLSEMARQITAQLDTRSGKLELLIKEADEKIAALKAAAANGASNGPATQLPSASPPSLEPDPRHAEIYLLADRGRSPNEIARELNRPSGEIELILALRPRP